MTEAEGQLETVRDHFDADSQHWEDIYRVQRPWQGEAQNFPSRLRSVRALTDGLVGDLLDVGCGTGMVTLALVDDRVRSVTGVDISDEMIRRARDNAVARALPVPAKFAVSRAEELDFPDASFDVLCAVGVFEYVDAPERFLAELARVARPGAGIVITVPNRLSPLRGFDKAAMAVLTPVLRLVRGLLGKSRPPPPEILHRAYTRREMQELGRRVGLELDAHRYCTFCSAVIERVIPIGGPVTRLMDSVADRPWLSWPATNLLVRFRKR